MSTQHRFLRVSFFLSAFVVATIAFSTVVSAQNFFDGDTSNPGDWNDAANWDNDMLPTTGGAVNIGSVDGGLASATATITGPLTNSTVAGGGATFDYKIGSGGAGGADGTVDHRAGTLTTGGWNFVGVDAGPGTSNIGRYNLSGTAVFNTTNVAGTDNRFFLGFGGGDGSGATNTGILTVADTASATFNSLVVGSNDDNIGMVTQTGGTITYNSWMTVGGDNGSTGTYDISGGILQQNADFLTVGENATGTVNVSGTADLNLDAGGLNIGRNATGVGTFNILGDTATINTTDLFVGDGGAGTLGFTSQSSVSAIIASGDVTLGDATLDVDFSISPPSGNILLVDVGGTLTGTFNGLAEGDIVADSGGRRITYLFGDGNNIALVIPEPSGLALLALVGLGTCLRRRR